jgi:RimJ/RimL family protein N-acetyltransferase
MPLQSGLVNVARKNVILMKINLQPNNLGHSIAGENVTISLIPLQENHFEELYAVANDELLWEQHPNKLRYQREVFRNFFDGAILSKGAFLIRDSKTNQVVGSSRFYDYDEKENLILIGYTFIGRPFWGKGYNAILKKIMLDYAFQFVDKVHFHVGATNFRSQKAMAKIGTTKIEEVTVAYHGEEEKLNFVYEITKNNV